MALRQTMQRNVFKKPQEKAPKGSAPVEERSVAAEPAAQDPAPEAAAPAPVQAVGAGRNDPCPCGSGKKFKKCCG